MPANSILGPDGLHLAQNVIYRARMQINAPGFAATEGKVRDALAQQGFADITFFDKKQLPPDWPADQVADPSGALAWTAYLQGRFTLTDRVITFGELPGTVTVLGMWLFLVPVASPAAAPPSNPDASVPVLVPDASTDVPVGSKVLVSAIGMAASFFLVRWVLRASKRRA